MASIIFIYRIVQDNVLSYRMENKLFYLFIYLKDQTSLDYYFVYKLLSCFWSRFFWSYIKMFFCRVPWKIIWNEKAEFASTILKKEGAAQLVYVYVGAA